MGFLHSWSLDFSSDNTTRLPCICCCKDSTELNFLKGEKGMTLWEWLEGEKNRGSWREKWRCEVEGQVMKTCDSRYGPKQPQSSTAGQKTACRPEVESGRCNVDSGTNRMVSWTSCTLVTETIKWHQNSVKTHTCTDICFPKCFLLAQLIWGLLLYPLQTPPLHWQLPMTQVVGRHCESLHCPIWALFIQQHICRSGVPPPFP